MTIAPNFAVFVSKATAQAACDAIWTALQGKVPPDVRCADGLTVAPTVTTGWATPMQRQTDGLWAIPLSPDVTISGQAAFVTAPYSAAWFSNP